jgi:integrase
MGFYRLKRDGKPYGPWIVKFPKGRNSETGEIVYTTCRAGHYRWKAQEIFQEKMAEWRQKCQPGFEPKKDYTFGELADWYLSLPITSGVRSVKKIQQHCRKLKEEFGSLRADEIRPFMIEAYRAKRLAEISRRGTPYKPASINREIEVMKRIYNIAMREEMVTRNPCWKVTRLPEKNARKRILSPEELDRLLKKLPLHAQDIVVVAYYTGMRPGEIFGLTRDRVNLKEGYLDLTEEDTKTGEARRVYFTSTPAEEIFKRLCKVRDLSTDHVFTYQGNPLKSIKVVLKRALQETGISDFRLYDLRHTFNTNARRAGIDRTVIMKLTGHKTLSMFTQYNTVDPAEGKDATRRLVSYLKRESETASGLLQNAEKGSAEKPNPLI